MRAAIRRSQSHLPVHLPALIYLTDPRRTPNPHITAARLPPGSCTLFRHFGEPALCKYAWQLAKTCAAHEQILLIAADPALALAVGADGVHWPENRLREARHWRGRFAIQTASAHSRRAIWRARRAGMDAVLVSPVFPSNSPSAGHPLSPARLRQLVRGAGLPVYALGGVKATTAGRVADWAGLAAIEGVTEAYGPA